MLPLKLCLGHQALIQAFGGEVVHAGEVLHGKVSRIQHDNQAMFKDIALQCLWHVIAL